MQRHRFHRADHARAVAVRAGGHGAFQNAGADALARHFQKAEMRDAADLDARPVVLQAVLELALDGPIVLVLLHVDEVDHDQAGKVAQPQLARHFLRRFQVRLDGGVLDIVLARRLAGVDVDGDQRLGLVDDDVAARLQRHLRREHRIELALDHEAREDRRRVLVGLDVLGMARHEHAHEVLGLAIAFVAGHQDLVDVLVVEVADRALDQRSLLIDEVGRRRLQRQVAHILPQPHQVLEIALDLGLGAAGAGGAQDHAHALRHFQLGGDLLQPLAVGRGGDLARDAAAAGGVRHQHRVAAGQRQVGGQRGALVAALFLDDLDKQHLPALDDFLDLVLLAVLAGALGQLLQRVFRADRLDIVFAVLGLLRGDGLAVLLLGRLGGLGLAARGTLVLVGAGGLGFLLLDERLTVGHRDLVVVGMDLAEGQEAVTVAAVIDEGGLQRRLDARYLGQIDVAAKLLAVRGLEIKFLDPVSAHHDDPGLLRVRGIDKHLVCH